MVDWSIARKMCQPTTHCRHMQSDIPSWHSHLEEGTAERRAYGLPTSVFDWIAVHKEGQEPVRVLLLF